MQQRLHPPRECYDTAGRPNINAGCARCHYTGEVQTIPAWVNDQAAYLADLLRHFVEDNGNLGDTADQALRMADALDTWRDDEAEARAEAWAEREYDRRWAT